MSDQTSGIVPDRWREQVFLLAMVLAFSLVPKFIGLTQQSLWLDELNVVRFIAFPSLDSSFFNALRNEPHPPLYILLLWTYGSMAGTGEFWLRLSSAFFGALAVLACYFAFKRVFGWKVALVTTALFGMAPVGLYEAQNLRPYSLVFLLAILSTVAFVQYVGLARIHGSLSGALPAVTVSNLLLCFTHYSGIFFSAAQATYLVAFHLSAREWVKALRVTGAFALALGPALAWLGWSLLIYDPGATSNLRWTVLDLVSPIRAFFGQPSSLVLIFLPIITAGSLQLRGVRATFEGNPFLVPLGAVVLLHCAFIISASFIHPSWMQNKNFYVAFPAAYLLFAVVLLETRALKTATGTALIVLVCIATLVTFLVTGYPLHSQNFFSPFRHQTREAAQLLAHIATERDTVLFGQIDMNGNGFVLEPTKLYLSVVDPKIGQRMKAKMRSLSFKERRETRLQEIKSALESSRKDGGKLIIDLPHSSGLYPEERALLEREAFCVLAHQLKSHSIIEVLHDAEACKGWKVVTSLVVNAGANRSTS